MRTLDVVPYNPQWPVEFERERPRLADAMGSLAVRIDHNGSTSVPGLDAKPIIDIQISVRPLHPLAPYEQRLAPLGYTHVPHEDDAMCPFFHRPEHWPHSHHIHLVESGGEEERRTLAFRDYLREHAEAAREYAELKKRLAAHVDADDPVARERYALAKSDFIEAAIAKAFAAGLPRDL